jgi:hypothetical protein
LCISLNFMNVVLQSLSLPAKEYLCSDWSGSGCPLDLAAVCLCG